MAVGEGQEYWGWGGEERGYLEGQAGNARSRVRVIMELNEKGRKLCGRVLAMLYGGRREARGEEGERGGGRDSKEVV